MSTLKMTIVMPVHNEARRLPPYLRDVVEYCEQEFTETFEVLLVDDGSSDRLDDAIRAVLDTHGGVRVIRHRHNRGKGAALRTGVLHARGEVILVADADGATPICEEAKLRIAIEQGASVAIGSRCVKGSQASRTRIRRCLGRIFAGMIRVGMRVPVRDSQCGFKMFRQPIAKRLFSVCREQGYLLDVEMLSWAFHLRCRVAEVPVKWSERQNGQLRIVHDGARMLLQLLALRMRLHRQFSMHPSTDAVPRMCDAANEKRKGVIR